MMTLSSNLRRLWLVWRRPQVRELCALRLLLLLALGLLAGCGQGEITVYQIPKEDPWKLPPGWKQREPGAMRVGRFAVPGKNGRDLEVSIIPLRQLPGSRADVVNIWREQMHLPQIQEEELSKLTEKVGVSRSQGELLDMISPEAAPGSTARSRTLLATLLQDQTTWFIKLTGDDDQVQQEKPTFLAFLKTLNFDTMPTPAPLPQRSSPAEAGETGHGPAETKAEARPQWTVPPGWQEQPQSQMLLAKFRISGANETRADVNISVEHGAGGGLLQNINRWRGQLGLSPADEPELARLLQPLDAAGGKAMMVDMNGTDARTRQPARLIGAILPRGGKTWFYKLMGNEQIAEREKPEFIKFVQNAKYPND